MNKSPSIFDFSGCVLAGGKSRRMGTDKALLEYNGKTLLSIAVEHFSGCPEILVSTSDAEQYILSGVQVVPDEQPGMGPLGGFISALRASRSAFVCFRPVDAPLVPGELHSMLANACLGRDAAVPVSKGSVEPLLACLSKTAMPVLEGSASGGFYKAGNIFSLLDTIYVPLDTPEMLNRFGDPSVYLHNANDPDSFEKLGSAVSGAPR